LLLGTVVFTGWLLDLYRLLQFHPELAPMQFNTALCFALAGLALGIRVWGRLPLAVPLLGAAVAILGSLTLAEHVSGRDMRIDHLFFPTFHSAHTPTLGRMSPGSALSFSLAGGALVLIGTTIPRWWKGLIVGSLSSVVISISLVALLGYALGLPGTYGWGRLSGIAIHTAATFAFLGTGIFLIGWHNALRRGEHTPRWLPIPLLLFVFTATLVLYFALESKQDEEIAQTMRAGAESVQNQISVRLENRIRGLARMTRRWQLAGDEAQSVWQAEAADYLHDMPDIDALEWIDSSHRVRWVIPHHSPEEDQDLSKNERRNTALRRAERSAEPVVSHIVKLPRGEIGFVVYVPVKFDGELRGMLAATFRAQRSLERYLPDAVAAGEAIKVSEGHQILYSRQATQPPSNPEWNAHEDIALPGPTWNLQVWPTPALAAKLSSPLPVIVLGAGALAAFLLAAICYLAQRSSRQAAETTEANAALQAALDQVKTLEGLLPICCTCKRVRDDSGYWSKIDTYIRRYTRASISHSYCPECAAKEFEKFGLAIPEKIQEEINAGNFE
jgi:sensor domain CHASE-containing protein